jgi:hypothetical protein
MNYHYADRVYRQHGLEYAITGEFFLQKKLEIAALLEREGIPYTFEF